MQSNHHDLPRSEAEWSVRFARDNRLAVNRHTIWVILNKGTPLSENDRTLVYSYSEMAKLVALRAELGRSTVYRYLEEACVDDDKAQFVTISNPDGAGLLIMFKPDHPDYFSDGKPRTPPKPRQPRRRKGGGNA